MQERHYVCSGFCLAYFGPASFADSKSPKNRDFVDHLWFAILLCLKRMIHIFNFIAKEISFSHSSVKIPFCQGYTFMLQRIWLHELSRNVKKLFLIYEINICNLFGEVKCNAKMKILHN